MRTSSRLGTLVLVALLAASLGISGPAQATWLFSHGNVAVIENPAACTYKNYGWGLQIEQNPGIANWVHLTVPTQYSATIGARYVKLRFYTGSVDAFVSEIAVWNGDTRIQEFKNLSYSNGWKDVQIDLGSKVRFTRGLGISVKIAAGVESMSHRFIFSSAGANFTQ